MEVAVLSPHRDDAAFSLGLTLFALLQAGCHLTLVNVCTHTDYAPYLPETLPSASRTLQVTSARAAEDAFFVSTLVALAGASPAHMRQADLAWYDAPLRHQLPAEDTLSPTPISATEISALAATLRALPPPDLVLAPLALGGHLDHRLVHTAVNDAFPADRLLFYEDLPYIARIAPELRQQSRRLALPRSATATTTPPPAPHGLKRHLALCYPSQIAPGVADEIDHYAAALGITELLSGTPAAVTAVAPLLRPAETLA